MSLHAFCVFSSFFFLYPLGWFDVRGLAGVCFFSPSLFSNHFVALMCKGWLYRYPFFLLFSPHSNLCHFDV